jgi:hypothetical protein
MCHLPLHLSPELHVHDAAIHSINCSPHLDNCIVPALDDTTSSLTYGVSATDMAQVHMLPTPYNEAFEEELDLHKFDFSHHRAAGMAFLPQDNRLILASMAPSTPGARIPRWCTRLQGAWLLSINGTPVHTLAEVHQAFHNLSLSQPASCILLFAHPKISQGLSNKGLLLLCHNQIPQLSIDQLSNCWTSTLNPPPGLPKAPTWDILIDGNVWNVVTKVMKLTWGKLMKQDNWTDWNKSKHLQLDQYDKQFMFGDPVAAEDELAIFHLVWTYVVKELDGHKKAQCVCDGLLVPARYRSLTTHMRTALTELACASSMQYLPQRTCSFTAQTSPMHLLKHHRQNKGSSSTQIRHSMTGGSIKRVNHQSPTATSYPSLAQCRATPSPPIGKKHIDRMLRDIGLSPTIHELCISSGLILGKRVLFMR